MMKMELNKARNSRRGARYDKSEMQKLESKLWTAISSSTLYLPEQPSFLRCVGDPGFHCKINLSKIYGIEEKFVRLNISTYSPL